MSKTIGITGSRGLLGWQVAVRLGCREELRVKQADRTTFLSAAALQAFVAECDAIVHLAGMNREVDDRVALSHERDRPLSGHEPRRRG